MNVDQLHKILTEYPMSMKLKVVVDGALAEETTVVQTIIKLQYEQFKARPGDRTDLLLNYFGRSNCIVRERGDFTDDVAGYKRWLELDLR